MGPVTVSPSPRGDLAGTGRQDQRTLSPSSPKRLKSQGLSRVPRPLPAGIPRTPQLPPLPLDLDELEADMNDMETSTPVLKSPVVKLAPAPEKPSIKGSGDDAVPRRQLDQQLRKAASGSAASGSGGSGSASTQEPPPSSEDREEQVEPQPGRLHCKSANAFGSNLELPAAVDSERPPRKSIGSFASTLELPSPIRDDDSSTEDKPARQPRKSTISFASTEPERRGGGDSMDASRSSLRKSAVGFASTSELPSAEERSNGESSPAEDKHVRKSVVGFAPSRDSLSAEEDRTSRGSNSPTRSRDLGTSSMPAQSHSFRMSRTTSFTERLSHLYFPPAILHCPPDAPDEDGNLRHSGTMRSLAGSRRLSRSNTSETSNRYASEAQTSVSFERSRRSSIRRTDRLSLDKTSLRTGRTTALDEDENTGKSWCWVFENIVSNAWFEPAFASLILLNTIVMAVEMQYKGMEHGYQLEIRGEEVPAETVWPHAQLVFTVCEWIFGVLFTIELSIKVLAQRCAFVKDLWNWLDTMIVAFWFIGSALKFLPNPTMLRVVRLVRLMRLLRLVRTLQGLESLYLMTTSIMASILALMWSTILLFLMQVGIALILNQLLVSYIEGGDDPSENAYGRHQVYRYYGTFSKALLTMFEFMLANWPPSSRVLTENVSEFWVIFILGYQCIIGFAVVKVIMGMFLQVTFNVASTDDRIMLNQKERSIRTHTKKMNRLFAAADQDNNGFIDKEEFRQMVGDPVVVQWLASMDCDMSLFARDPERLFELVDDGDDELKVEELVSGVARMQGPARSIDLAVLADEGRQIRDLVSQLSDVMAAMKSRCFWGAAKEGWVNLGRGLVNATSSPAQERRQADQYRSRSDARRPTISAVMFKELLEASRVQQKEEEKSSHWWKISLTDVVASNKFEMLFACLIMVNTMVLAAQVQYNGFDLGHSLGYCGPPPEPESQLDDEPPWIPSLQNCTNIPRPAKEIWPWAGTVFPVADWVLVVAFTLEALIKIAAMRTVFFKDAWNWFDLALVLFGYIDLFGTDWFPKELPPSTLRLARMTRLLRILRLVRLQGFDSLSLHLMITALKYSMYTLLWSTMLMIVVQMMIALVLNTLLEPYLLEPSNDTSLRLEVYRYFGTFDKAMLTMFEITLANWIPVCRTLTENVSEWFVIFALTHKFLIGFAVVMVITGVFTQETFKVAATDDTIMINQKQRQIKTHAKKMSKLFNSFDVNGDGILDRDEFRAMADDPIAVNWLSSMGLEVSDADNLFNMVLKSAQRPDMITAVDLIKGIARLKGHAKSIDMAVVLNDNRQLLQEVQQLQQTVAELKQTYRPGSHRKDEVTVTTP